MMVRRTRATINRGAGLRAEKVRAKLAVDAAIEAATVVVVVEAEAGETGRAREMANE
jgi:hypothetical protein